MKKIFGIILLCLMLMLAACGGEKAPETTVDSGLPPISDATDTPVSDATDTGSVDGGDELEDDVITLNGKALSDYVIVINDAAYEEDAINFAKKLKKSTGVQLEVVDSAEEGALAINYGTLSTENAWEYRIEVDGTSVNLYGAGTSGALYAADMLLSLTEGQERAVIENTTYSVKDLLMENKTYAMQRLFDENGKLVDGGIAEPVVIYASQNEIPADVAASDPIVVVFLGASNSEGGTIYFQIFTKALADLLHKNVVYYNAGVGGTGTNLSAARFYQSAGQYAPDIIIFDDNSNDTGNGTIMSII